MASGEIVIDKDALNSKRESFSQCQKKFNSGAYNTYKNSYLSKSWNTWVHTLGGNLDAGYQKISDGYRTIVDWWDSYMSEVDDNETKVPVKIDVSDGKKPDFSGFDVGVSTLNSAFSSGLSVGNSTIADTGKVTDENKSKKSKSDSLDATLKGIAEAVVATAEASIKSSGSSSSSSGIGGTLKGIADAVVSTAEASIKNTSSTSGSSDGSSDGGSSFSDSSTGSTSASISTSTTDADSVNKVEQSTSNTTGTTSDSNQGNVSDNVNNTDGNKSNITNENDQNTGGNNASNGSNSGTISDNVNNTDGDKSNITNGTNSGTSGTDIGNGNVTEDLLKTKIDKAINDYNTTHTSEVLPSLNYNEFEDIIRELKEIGLTDDEIAQTVVEIMKAKYY